MMRMCKPAKESKAQEQNVLSESMKYEQLKKGELKRTWWSSGLLADRRK